jgi:penicillin-binding protein 1A
VALAALEDGLSLHQPLHGDGPIELDYGGPEPWRVANYEGANAGTVDLRGALVKSVNTAFAQLGVAVGTEKLSEMASRLGIDTDAALGSEAERGPSMALGGIAQGVSPLEMAGAYAVLANDGRRVEPYLVQRVLDPSGTVLYEHEAPPKPVIDPAIAGTVRTLLQDVVKRGTGTAAQLPGWEPLGKTGTSQDGADAWFVGSVPTLTAAVWVGDPNGRVPMAKTTGGTVAAPLWRQVVAAAVGDDAPVAFDAPPPLERSDDDELVLPEAKPCRAHCDED